MTKMIVFYMSLVLVHLYFVRSQQVRSFENEKVGRGILLHVQHQIISLFHFLLQVRFIHRLYRRLELGHLWLW